ncbi:MAG TPA: hypothetical protein VJO35_17325 [Terriglobales bacterium]|nr:hypothetical protein [Terriglobales bacterium]
MARVEFSHADQAKVSKIGTQISVASSKFKQSLYFRQAIKSDRKQSIFYELKYTRAGT